MFLKHNHFLAITFHDSPLPRAVYLKQGPVYPRAARPMIYMTCLPGVEEIWEETK